jgi:hypothetical protein
VRKREDLNAYRDALAPVVAVVGTKAESGTQSAREAVDAAYRFDREEARNLSVFQLRWQARRLRREPAELAYHEARREALTQSTIRLRLMRRRLVRGSDPLSRARRQALDNELLARGYSE